MGMSGSNSQRIGAGFWAAVFFFRDMLSPSSITALLLHSAVLELLPATARTSVIRCRFIFSGKNDELTPDFVLRVGSTMRDRDGASRDEPSCRGVVRTLDLHEHCVLLTDHGAIGSGELLERGEETIPLVGPHDFDTTE